MTDVHVAICRSWHVSVVIQLPALTDAKNVCLIMTITYALIQMVESVGRWTCLMSAMPVSPRVQCDANEGKLKHL